MSPWMIQRTCDHEIYGLVIPLVEFHIHSLELGYAS